MRNGNPAKREPPGTILLVEDHSGVRSLARTVLSGAGYRVLEALHGQEALEHCSRQPEPIQLLITDMILPEMSGADLAQRITAVWPNVKVLYMSGYPAEEFGLTAEGLACQPFLQKPFGPDLLLQKVRELLQGSH